MQHLHRTQVQVSVAESCQSEHVKQVSTQFQNALLEGRTIIRFLADFDTGPVFNLSDDPDGLIHLLCACEEGIQVLARDTE